MSSILTNPRVALTMDDLELRARAGDPWAQAEFSKRCKEFAVHVMEDTAAGADMHERKKLVRIT